MRKSAPIKVIVHHPTTEVGKRELEVVVLDEVVVGSISIAQHVVHLVVER